MESDRLQLALLSMLTIAIMSGPGCGRLRDHVYRSRLIGHYVAYLKDYRKQPPTGDTLDLKENGTCIHSYLQSGESNRKEESCTWTLIDRLDGSWLLFEDLANGIHRRCTTHCVVEAAAWDGEFVTGFDLPSAPDFFYAK